jgi:hypothetical protein
MLCFTLKLKESGTDTCTKQTRQELVLALLSISRELVLNVELAPS